MKPITTQTRMIRPVKPVVKLQCVLDEDANWTTQKSIRNWLMLPESQLAPGLSVSFWRVQRLSLD